jgi:hypothetical protein
VAAEAWEEAPGTRQAERWERLALKLANGCMVGAFEEAYGVPWEDRALGADAVPSRLEPVDQGVLGGSFVAQVTRGQEVPQQDEQLACARYERDGPEHKRVEVGTEVLHQGVACAEG